MELVQYINSLDASERESFERAVSTSIGYLRKAVSTGQRINPLTCSLIEAATNNAVMRWDLRPTDWSRIWPELTEHPNAPASEVPA